MSTGGALTMISPGGNDTVATNAYYAGASADGSRVFLRSEEALTGDDSDQYQDVYENHSGALTRLSRGPAGGNGAAHASYGGASAGRDARVLRDRRVRSTPPTRTPRSTSTSATTPPRIC